MVEIEDFFKQYKSAVYEKDVKAFVHMYAADVCVYDLWGQWSIVGIDAWTLMVGDCSDLSEMSVLLWSLVTHICHEPTHWHLPQHL